MASRLEVAEQARRLAVVLFNLGGPDSLKAVRPFLFNLFADRAIIGVERGVRDLEHRDHRLEIADLDRTAAQILGDRFALRE